MAKGSWKNMPEVWAPPSYCERDGKRIYTTWGEPRTLCRACQKQLAREQRAGAGEQTNRGSLDRSGPATGLPR